MASYWPSTSVARFFHARVSPPGLTGNPKDTAAVFTQFPTGAGARAPVQGSVWVSVSVCSFKWLRMPYLNIDDPILDNQLNLFTF